jgi:hypothetical protein
MNIPESAITPFEPHGIPKLHRDDNAARDALRRLYRQIQQHCVKEVPLSISGIWHLINNRIEAAGAETVDLRIDGPYHDAVIPFCKISVLYRMPGGRLRGSYTPLKHPGGFK